MRPVEHPFEPRGLRNDEATIHASQEVDELYVVMMRLHGPRGPWDYVVAVYFPDGTRAGCGSWQGPRLERAQEVYEDFVRALVRDDKVPTNEERVARWRDSQRAAS